MREAKPMSKFRSLLSLLLVAIAVLLLNSGDAIAAKKVAQPPSYTPEQLEQIEKYAGDIEELRQRMLDIPQYVRQKRWRDIETLVHGPLGELRAKMGNLTRNLTPDLQASAREASKDVFGHLVKIDEAARENDSRKLLTNYNGALEDFETFLGYIPQQLRAPMDAS